MTISCGCHCGKCRYSVDLEHLTDVAICHCSACRRTTGGTHVTWATIPRSVFRWEVGTPVAYHSSDHATRYFCPTCGAQLAFTSGDEPGAMDITVSTLDNPHPHAPDRHIWIKSKLEWIHPDDGLPQEPQETQRDHRPRPR